MGRAPIASVLAAVVLAPTAAAAVPFKVSVEFSKRSPKAGVRWEYAVIVTDRSGTRIPATVYPQVFVDGSPYDKLGAHYTLLGIVDNPYTWSKRLRGRSGVVFRVTVYAVAKKLVLEYPVRVR
jgi:hypothetical protein